MITTWAELDDTDTAWPAIEDILLSAATPRDFQSASERDRFCRLWAGYYRDRAPQHFYLWRDDDGAVLAYLCALANSAEAVELIEAQPAFTVFADYFARYPAHFHVNCRADCRGRGIGGALVERFIRDCRKGGVAGVHLVTAEGARNVAFYRRHGMRAIARRSWRGRALQLMGRRLAATKAAPR